MSKYTLLFLLTMILFCGKNQEESDNPRKPKEMYSLEEPAEWKNIRQGHAPQVRIRKSNIKTEVIITLDAPNLSERHYFEVIGIMTKEKKILIEKKIKRMRNPRKIIAFDASNLPRGKKLYAFAKCNLHDLWVTEFEIPD